MESQTSLPSAALSTLGKRWVHGDTQSRDILALSQFLGEPEIIARLLFHRGITPEAASAFLSPTLKHFLPNPFHLLDMDKAVARIHRALETKEPMALFGDYDVDGATSSALLYRFLASLGCPPLIYIPDRLKEGYGPTLPAFLSLKEKGIHLIITVDCGTTAASVLEDAQQQGIDTIVLDHHKADDHLPRVVAVVNPNRKGQISVCQNLAAVGVCFLFCIALNRFLKEKGFYTSRGIFEPDLLRLLDLVALGTVCDVVPLTGVNRAFVAQGLKVMGKRTNRGLKTLSDFVGIEEMPTPYHCGFVFGPRINAGGRVGEASLGSSLLISEDSSDALALSQKLNAYNEERRQLEALTLQQADDQVQSHLAHRNPPFLCVASEAWHPGIIGIVAGRLKDTYHRPVAVLSVQEGIAKGSARSVQGFDLGEHLLKARAQGLLMEGGGHAMAGGFRLLMEKREAFQDFIASFLEGIDLTPTLFLEGNLALSGVTVEFIQALSRLEPYGVGNPRPRFAIQDARLVSVQQVGTTHVRCILKDLKGYTVKAMAFQALKNPLGEALLKAQGSFVEMAGTLSLNTWGGQETPQIFIEDLL